MLYKPQAHIICRPGDVACVRVAGVYPTFNLRLVEPPPALTSEEASRPTSIWLFGVGFLFSGARRAGLRRALTDAEEAREEAQDCLL